MLLGLSASNQQPAMMATCHQSPPRVFEAGDSDPGRGRPVTWTRGCALKLGWLPSQNGLAALSDWIGCHLKLGWLPS